MIRREVRAEAGVFDEWWRALSGRVIGSGFNLIALLILLSILGIFAARATPGYLTYAKDAKTVEARLLAGSLWGAVTGNATGTCGAPAAVTAGYPKAGLDSTGSTIPARWSVIATGTTAVTVDCFTGTITPDGELFLITGTAADVNSIRVKLNHRSANTSPWQLQCSSDAGISFRDC
jgi:Tfp pilus assembly protein PilE